VKFLADECCDAGVVEALRHDGHDVLYAVGTLTGAADDDLLDRAYKEQRILLTEDKDFGELVYRLRKPAFGVILLRFDVIERTLKIPRLRHLLNQEAQRLPSAFVVLEVDKSRLRPLLG
jgi:predicted nuclease of predicted toxin-antitoxin system